MREVEADRNEPWRCVPEDTVLAAVGQRAQRLNGLVGQLLVHERDGSLAGGSRTAVKGSEETAKGQRTAVCLTWRH